MISFKNNAMPINSTQGKHGSAQPDSLISKLKRSLYHDTIVAISITAISGDHIGNGYAQDAAKRDHQQMHRLHKDPKAYMRALEDPKRDEYQKPHEVLTALNIKPGETIADIGAGSGYFTFRWPIMSATKAKSSPSTSAPTWSATSTGASARPSGQRRTILADPDDPCCQTDPSIAS